MGVPLDAERWNRCWVTWVCRPEPGSPQYNAVRNVHVLTSEDGGREAKSEQPLAASLCAIAGCDVILSTTTSASILGLVLQRRLTEK